MVTTVVFDVISVLNASLLVIEAVELTDKHTVRCFLIISKFKQIAYTNLDQIFCLDK